MTLNENHNYDDIIHLPHHVSRRHPQMSLSNRAAQFSPFAALTGHDAAIEEATRMTDSFVELDEDKKSLLDAQLRLIQDHLKQQPECQVTYFQPDEKKSGGTYITICGRVKKINQYEHRIVFTDGTTLPIYHLFSIRGELFQNMDML